VNATSAARGGKHGRGHAPVVIFVLITLVSTPVLPTASTPILCLQRWASRPPTPAPAETNASTGNQHQRCGKHALHELHARPQFRYHQRLFRLGLQLGHGLVNANKDNPAQILLPQGVCSLGVTVVKREGVTFFV